MTTRREETMVTRNLTGREREVILTSQVSQRKRTTSKVRLLKSLRLSKKPRRETWLRHKQESMTRLLRKREIFSKFRDLMRSSS